tara:strand:- start:686 stop:895 length:210 start_codon:yes stop_codon:yes gene_type:complete
MSRAHVGDLVWVPDQTCGWGTDTVIAIRGPSLGLIKETQPLIILVNVEGAQTELAVLQTDIYDIGDLYD